MKKINEFENAGLLIPKGEVISCKRYEKLIKLDSRGQLTASAHIGEIGYMQLIRFTPSEVICILRSMPLKINVKFYNVGQPGSAIVLNKINNVKFHSITPFIMKGGKHV